MRTYADACGRMAGEVARVSAYLATVYADRFHHAIVETARLRAGGLLENLFRRAKATVIISDCLFVTPTPSAPPHSTPTPSSPTYSSCPSEGFWGEGVYTAVAAGGLVFHNQVAAYTSSLRPQTLVA